jgi:chromosome segregation ATPase
MNVKRRKTQKSKEHTPLPTKSPSSPLLNIIKLPTLPKVSSPQMSHRFFPKIEEETKKVQTSERKPTQSLYSFSFSKLAEEVKSRKKSKESLIIKPALLDQITSEQSIESYLESQPSVNFQVIQETNDESFQENKPSHKNSISVRDSDENILSVPVELGRKSRQKTIKTEKAVETCTLMEDELENLRRVLRMEQEKFREIENKYMGSLEQVRVLHEVLGNLEDKETEYEKLLKVNHSLRSQIDELQNKTQSDNQKSQKAFQEIKDDVISKTGEIEMLKSLLNKSDLTKKRYAESIGQLESEVKYLQGQNDEFKSLLDKANNEAHIFNSRFLQEKGKVEQMEEVHKQLDSLKSQNYDQQDKIIALERQLLIVTAEANEFRNAHKQSNSQWREKKKKLKDIILKLNEQIENESKSIKNKIADAFKTKRSITLRDREDNVFAKENVIKMQQKVIELEMELNDTKLDRDKFKSSVEYCKGVIETKNTIISILEEQIRKTTGGQAFDDTVKDSKSICKGIEKYIKDIKDFVKCGLCLGNSEFFMVQCEHLVCSTCQGFQDRCPVCAREGRVFSVPVFKKIYQEAEGIGSAVQGLIKLFKRFE